VLNSSDARHGVLNSELILWNYKRPRTVESPPSGRSTLHYGLLNAIDVIKELRWRRCNLFPSLSRSSSRRVRQDTTTRLPSRRSTRRRISPTNLPTRYPAHEPNRRAYQSRRKDTKNESRRRAYQGATRRADEYKDIVEKVFLEPRGRRFSLGAAASNSDCFVAGTRFIS
jgi:hypothetical protein